MGDDSRVLTCVYCGHQYPQDTPDWGNQVLTDHIKVCDKHPMRELEARVKSLETAIDNVLRYGPDSIFEDEGAAIAFAIANPDLALGLGALFTAIGELAETRG